MEKTEADKKPEGTPEAPSAPRRPGPKYNGGDPIAAATSELITFLTGSEVVLGGVNPFPQGSSVRAGGGSLSGSRNYSDYGFINGTFGGGSYSDPDIGRTHQNTQTTTGGGGGFFGPFFGNGNGGGVRRGR